MKDSLLCLVALILSLTMMQSCKEKPVELPIIGNRTDLDGTVHEHKIRSFELTNQLGETVTNDTYRGNIHVVDFFFTYCPTICPRVAAQMKRIYEHTSDKKDVMYLSHTLDPKRDSISVLKKYADNLEIDHNIWHFLYGDKDLVYDLANEDYFIAALEAPDAPGGFDHSGKIILLDKEARIRGFCDGTDPESVDRFMKTIDALRATYE